MAELPLYLTELYGDDADAKLIELGAMEDPNGPITIAPVGAVLGSDGTYTLTSGWQTNAFAYTGQASDYAVYSVAITGTKMSANTFEVLAGLAISNGTEYADGEQINTTAYDGTVVPRANKSPYYSVSVGFRNPISSGADALYGMVAGFSKAGNFNVASNCIRTNFGDTESTHTVTVVLYKDVFHFYNDDILIGSVAVDDARFKVTGASGTQYGFNKGDTFYFGVSAVNVANPVKAKVAKELYGQAALAEIQSKYYGVLENSIAPVGAVLGNDGVYSITSNWQTNGFAYTCASSDYAVYSVAITSSKLAITGGIEVLAGISISNGSKYVDGEQMKTNGGSLRAVKSPNYSVTVGIRNPISNGNDALYGMVAGFSQAGNFNVASTCTRVNFGEEESTHTVTAVLYNDVFYFYNDDVFIASMGVDDSRFKVTGNSGTQYGFAAGDTFHFGVSAVNVTPTIKAKVLKQLVGSEALADIVANYSSEIQVA